MPILTRRKMPGLLRLKDEMPDPKIRVLRTTLNGNPEPHAHEARVTKEGYGITTIDHGHFHKVAEGVVEKAIDHDHKLIAFKHVRRIGLRVGQFHDGAEVESPAKGRRPLGGASGAGVGAGNGPGLPQGGAPGGSSGVSGEVQMPGADVFAWREFIPGPVLNEALGPSTRYTLLADILREGDTVLDVGCGNGLLYDWLTRVLKRPTSYFGVDMDTDLLREFRERRPEVGNRTAPFDYLRTEIFEDAHFNVATCFGLPSQLGCGPDRLGRLGGIIHVMKSLADIVVVECLDNLYRPLSPDGPTSWGVAEVRQLIGEWKHTVVRPLTDHDFAIVAYRDGIL